MQHFLMTTVEEVTFVFHSLKSPGVMRVSGRQARRRAMNKRTQSSFAEIFKLSSATPCIPVADQLPRRNSPLHIAYWFEFQTHQLRAKRGRGLLIHIFLEEPLERPTCTLRLEFILVLIHMLLDEPLERPAGAENLPALLTYLSSMQLSACLSEYVWPSFIRTGYFVRGPI